MLMRVFLGWLRGERGHCGMVAIPTMEEEDARRPSRERESLINERSRITNRMKSALNVQVGHAREVATGSVEACNQTELYRVVSAGKHNRDRGSSRLRC
jgi:transposase